MKTKTKQAITLLLIVASTTGAFAQSDAKAYVIFNKQGKEVSFKQMIKTLSEKRVVFFGEMHNCPISHWLEFETAKELYARHQKGLVMGAEMFEADNQLILNEYLQNDISEKSFESEMRLWPNYSTDYVKLVDFAKENAIPFIATNIPRRYAQIVSRKGFEGLNALSPEARKYVSPLPIPYVEDSVKTKMFGQMMAMMGGRSNKKQEFVSQAQSIKDATMAWRIAQSLDASVTCFLHFNGSFHSDNKDGIIPFLHGYKDGLSVTTVSCCRQDDLSRLDEENYGRGDFMICIPADMVYSY